MERAKINPGDVRTFQQGEGKAVVVGLGVWAEQQGRWVQIHVTGPNHSHTTVTNNPESERYHRTLFRDLRRTLMEQGCWMYGEQGNETEERTASQSRFRPVPIRGESLSATIIADRGE
jgi:hypothetical protein